MPTIIKIIGIDNTHKKTMLALFKNHLLSKQFKISEDNYDVILSIDNKHLTLTSKDNVNSIKLNIPFSINDLLNIINNLVAEDNQKNILKIQNISIDIKNSTVTKNKRNVTLTEKEIRIITCLFEAKGTALTREELLKNIWGYSENIDTHTLESHIYKLRQKIEDDAKNPQIIITNNGAYKLIV